jgi:hypothetical protein
VQKKQRKRDKEEFCQRFDERKVDVENVNTTKRALLAGRDRERTSAFPPQSRMESDKIDVSQKLCSLLLLMMMIGKKITRRTSSRETMMDLHVRIDKKELESKRKERTHGDGVDDPTSRDRPRQR